jgi:hypothetical protein
MMAPTMKMPLSWGARYKTATVCAGAVSGYAQSPDLCAVGRNMPMSDVESIHLQADEMQRIFDKCPAHQRGAAAQAMMAIT